MSGTVQGRRAKRASLIAAAACALLVLACACSSALQGCSAGLENGTDAGGDSSAMHMEDGSYAAAIWSSLSECGSFDSAVEQAGFRRIDEKGAPDWFEREVAPVAMFERIFTDSDNSLFELQMPGSPDDAMESVASRMAERGWICTPSDMAGVATFSKTEGECRWAMLEFGEMSGMCCMVLRIQPS